MLQSALQYRPLPKIIFNGLYVSVKSGTVDGLAEGTVVRYGICLFQRFHSFVDLRSFRKMCGCILLIQGNKKCTWKRQDV
jgi:hypothetical protein